ncbi:hypothetical protein FJZ17_00455 [Candidatus Pacearchaeota archaeon]|nr:hypothetical protein [Candidatus Pacearchaeota archaeon]
MNIVINGAEDAYKTLTKPPILQMPGAIPREAWQQEEDEEGSPKAFGFGFSFGPAELPEPFDSINVNFSRIRNYYKITARLTSRDATAFHGNSAFIKYFFKRKERIFFPTTPNSTGYVLNKQGQVQIAIMDMGENLEHRVIGMGSTGSNPLKMGDEIDFGINLKLLEATTDLFFNACMQAQVAAKRVRALPNIVINVNP